MYLSLKKSYNFDEESKVIPDVFRANYETYN